MMARASSLFPTKIRRGGWCAATGWAAGAAGLGGGGGGGRGGAGRGAGTGGAAIWGGRGGVRNWPGRGGAVCAVRTPRRTLEAMLLITPMTTSTTQTRIPTSRTGAAYFGGPASGGNCCESVEASVDVPIDERISVSAWMFFRR